MRTFLVTGGAGFIGSNLVEFLLKNGEKVKIIDNFTTGKRSNIAWFEDEIEVIEGDVRDEKALEKALDGVTHVVHLAAIPSVIESVEHPKEVTDNNLLSSVALFDAIGKGGKIKRIVQASSSAVYGEVTTIPIKESFTLDPLSPYAADKMAQEFYGSCFAKLYDLEIASLRFFNVYGPKQNPKSVYAGVIPIFIDAIEAEKNPTIFGDGTALRDFVYVGDVVKAIYMSSVECLEGQESFNIGTGKGTTIKELGEQLIHLLQSDVHIEYGNARAGEIKESLADVSYIEDKIGFKAEYTLEEGLTSLLQYMEVLPV